jgi:hypothetical protein
MDQLFIKKDDILEENEINVSIIKALSKADKDDKDDNVDNTLFIKKDDILEENDEINVSIIKALDKADKDDNDDKDDNVDNTKNTRADYYQDKFNITKEEYEQLRKKNVRINASHEVIIKGGPRILVVSLNALLYYNENLKQAIKNHIEKLAKEYLDKLKLKEMIAKHVNEHIDEIRKPIADVFSEIKNNIDSCIEDNIAIKIAEIAEKAANAINKIVSLFKCFIPDLPDIPEIELKIPKDEITKATNEALEKTVNDITTFISEKLYNNILEWFTKLVENLLLESVNIPMKIIKVVKEAANCVLYLAEGSNEYALVAFLNSLNSLTSIYMSMIVPVFGSLLGEMGFNVVSSGVLSICSSRYKAQGFLHTSQRLFNGKLRSSLGNNVNWDDQHFRLIMAIRLQSLMVIKMLTKRQTTLKEDIDNLQKEFQETNKVNDLIKKIKKQLKTEEEELQYWKKMYKFLDNPSDSYKFFESKLRFKRIPKDYRPTPTDIKELINTKLDQSTKDFLRKNNIKLESYKIIYQNPDVYRRAIVGGFGTGITGFYQAYQFYVLHNFDDATKDLADLIKKLPIDWDNLKPIQKITNEITNEVPNIVSKNTKKLEDDVQEIVQENLVVKAAKAITKSNLDNGSTSKDNLQSALKEPAVATTKKVTYEFLGDLAGSMIIIPIIPFYKLLKNTRNTFVAPNSKNLYKVALSAISLTAGFFIPCGSLLVTTSEAFLASMLTSINKKEWRPRGKIRIIHTILTGQEVNKNGKIVTIEDEKHRFLVRLTDIVNNYLWELEENKIKLLKSSDKSNQSIIKDLTDDYAMVARLYRELGKKKFKKSLFNELSKFETNDV